MNKIYYQPVVINSEKSRDFYLVTSDSYINTGIVSAVGGGIATGITAVVKNPDKVVAAIVAVDAVPGPANPG
ncbi:hypothetical protein [Lachnotalea glycerini]|uniref:Uncharacterized protein n=1 Tax=Lachnotalea glycerini TaxID=1763509 RepID=A0A371JB82_9FIRM|nr:hypothetical protein [Lachnotalea glycerini]RDY30019.1 hypothetical protein CG710_016935 [Lachnotalea glycerini]